MSKHDKRLEAFDRLVELEPRLRLLLQEAERVVDDGGKSFCANQIYYSRFKPQIERLVGWELTTGPAELQTCGAYNVAVDAIYHPLPNCRNCGCWGS